MADKRALIVDDEPDIRELLEITLGRMRIETWSAANLAEARALLAQEQFHLCLTDMNLPDGNGIDLVRHIATEMPQLPVAVITAFGSVEAAIAALKAGAYDFVQKPVALDQLRHLVETALKLKPIAEVAVVETDARLVGNSPVMRRLREQISKLSRSQAPIYVSGESGSGKEVVARLIHEQGPRGALPFVPVNCGAIPSELMESEFFGHRKGSFTGAVVDKEGLFQAASSGTLFLDEVADLPLPMQVKLLRAIQEKAVRPVGAQQEVSIDVRIVSATHRDLAAEVEAGRFRQDLYYRLNVIELRVPPLRERGGDVALLARHILERLVAEYGGDAPRIDPEAMAALEDYDFPGNVRELENILERAFALCEGNVIRVSDLQLAQPVRSRPPDSETGESVDARGSPPTHAAGESLEDYLEGIEKGVILEALEATRWNKTAAAKRLGITFRALRYRLKKLNLE